MDAETADVLRTVLLILVGLVFGGGLAGSRVIVWIEAFVDKLLEGQAQTLNPIERLVIRIIPAPTRRLMNKLGKLATLVSDNKLEPEDTSPSPARTSNFNTR